MIAGGAEGISLTNAEIVNASLGAGRVLTSIDAQNGRLEIDNLYADSFSASGDSRVDFKAAGDISLTNSYVRSFTGTGDSQMYFSTRKGGVTITGGTEVTSEVGYSGLAAIYFKNNDKVINMVALTAKVSFYNC